MAEATWGQLIQQAQGQLDLIPDGDVDVKIIDSQATKASTGKLMFKVKVEIADGPNIKRKLTTNIVVSDDNPMALAIFFRNMENIGLPSSFFSQEPNPDQVASAMVGRPARVKIGHRVWQGVDRNEVTAWLPPLGGGLGGPVAPGTVVGPAGPPLPTSATVPSTPAATPATPVPTQTPAPVVGNGPTVGAGPAAPSGPPALPI